MNTNELSSTIKVKSTNEVKGVIVKVLPEVGNGCYETFGSDRCGYVITEVAPDFTWFTYSKNGVEHGHAALITGKNRRGKGLYTRATWTGKRWKPSPIDCAHVRCSSFGVIRPTTEKGECEDYYDPSF